jgi:hypothetical protein
MGLVRPPRGQRGMCVSGKAHLYRRLWAQRVYPSRISFDESSGLGCLRRSPEISPALAQEEGQSLYVWASHAGLPSMGTIRAQVG